MSEYKKKYLDKISLYAYDEYIEAKENHQIVEEFFLGNKEGFVYIKNTEQGYSISISYDEDKTDLFHHDIIKGISTYLKENREVCYILINSLHKEMIEYFYNENFRMVYPAYNMILKREDAKQFDVDILMVPYTENRCNDFIDLLGEAFVPIRKKLGLKPYNWHINNKEATLKGFTQSMHKGTLYGYYIKEELVGVLEVVNNDLEMLAVKRTFQGKGIGSLLLKKGINIVFSNKVHKEMILSMLKGNDKAEELYKKHGFKVVSNQTILKKCNG